MTARKRRSTTIALAAGLGFIGITALVSGQLPTPTPSRLVDDEGGEARFPQTAEDHLAAAEEYRAKAVERRKEADLHRRMLAAYERLAADVAAQPAPPRKRGKTIPLGGRAKASKDSVAEYRAHCEAYTRGADSMADEAETLAEFHRARAQELRGTEDP